MSQTNQQEAEINPIYEKREEFSDLLSAGDIVGMELTPPIGEVQSDLSTLDYCIREDRPAFSTTPVTSTSIQTEREVAIVLEQALAQYEKYADLRSALKNQILTDNKDLSLPASFPSAEEVRGVHIHHSDLNKAYTAAREAIDINEVVSILCMNGSDVRRTISGALNGGDLKLREILREISPIVTDLWTHPVIHSSELVRHIAMDLRMEQAVNRPLVLSAFDSSKLSGVTPKEVEEIELCSEAHPLHEIWKAKRFGAYGVIAQSSFDLDNLERWLKEGTQAGVLSDLAVSLAIPVYHSAENARLLGSLSGITPENNPGLAERIGILERAERDGEAAFRNMQLRMFMGDLDWCKSNGFNAHVLPGVEVERALPAIHKVFGKRTHQVPRTFNGVELPGGRLVREFRHRMPVPTTVVSSISSDKKTPKGPDAGYSRGVYIDEAAPLLEKIQEVVLSQYEEDRSGFLNGEFWERLRVHVDYSATTSMATTTLPDIDFRSTSDGKVIEFHINLAAYSRERGKSLNSSERLGKELEEDIKRAKYGLLERENVHYLDLIDESIHQTLYTEIASHGWSIAPQVPGMVVGPNAENEGFLAHMSDRHIASLKSYPGNDSVCLEIGSMGAKGVVDYINKLHEETAHLLEIREKLRGSRYVFIDINEQSLQSAKDAIAIAERDGVLKDLGITFEYQKLPSLDSKRIYKFYQDLGLEGKVVSGRAVNTFDAFGWSSGKVIDGELYEVVGRTGIPVSAYRKIEAPIKTTGSDGIPTVLRPAEWGADSRSLIRFVMELKETENESEQDLPTRFLNEASTEFPGLPRSAAMELFKRLSSSMRIYRSYKAHEDINNYPWPSIGGEPKAQLLKDLAVAGRLENSFPETNLVLCALSTTIMPCLTKDGAFYGMQMTTDSAAINHQSKEVRTIFPSAGQFVWLEALETFGIQAGWDVQLVNRYKGEQTVRDPKIFSFTNRLIEFSKK